MSQQELQYLNPNCELNPSIEFFLKNLPSFPNILEMGTKRWGNAPTHHLDWFKQRIHHPFTYTMTDITEGLDVDRVSDAHELSQTFGGTAFNAVWATSVWEHLHSPWIAAKEVLSVLSRGGVFFIQTHFTFCEHGYPQDYFRFTRKALEHLFKDATEVVSCYDFPCRIQSGKPEENQPGYLNVCIAGIK